MNTKFFQIGILLLLAAGARSQESKWNVSEPGGPFKEVKFTVTEGTWMNIDVSPDGNEIVFDMLGDIYTLPVKGGKAKLLSSGLAFEVQPRYSHNGKYISFTSDRNGGDNIWYIKRDGSDAKPVTDENFRLLNNAVWLPDDQYIIARKHFTSTRSLGAGEMWMYHISGGDGLQLTKRKNDQQDVGEPAVSPDGRYVYYSEDVSPGGFFQYNKDPNGEIYAIFRFDRQTGKTEKITGGPGGAVRPQPSPDGQLLAFVKRIRLESVLYLHDLSTGEEWPVYRDLSKDQQETWATFGVYPNFDWTPDGKHIIIWAKGKIRRIDIEKNAAEEIPFEAEVNQRIYEAVKTPQRVFSESFEAKMIRQAITSPDGKKLVFNAAGYLYIKELPDGKPKRLTRGTDFEFEPSFSRDGDKLVYTTWNDQEKGSISQTDIYTGKTDKITAEKGFYFSPSFSPDGKLIIYRKGSGNSVHGYTYGKEPGIYTIPSGGGKPRKIIDHGSKPIFNSTGTRVFFQDSQDKKKAYKSISLEGKDERTHFISQYATQFVPSPDNKWVAFTELFNAYIAPFPQTGNPIDLSGTSSTVPVKKVSRDAGNYLHWSSDSKKLHWMLGPEYFTRELKNSFTFLDDAPDRLPAIDSSGIPVRLTLESDVPRGMLALKGARIITMKGDEVIGIGTILIENNRIRAVGRAENIKIPSEAKVIDVSGTTIMPGMVDVHAHINAGAEGISPKQDWSYFANLAYGVTTIHDPSSNTEMVFSQAEMVKTGRMTGPRIYSTGTILYGAEGDFKAVINSLEDARSHLRRLKAVGAFSVKSYNQPRREQRQQVIRAARELNMMVYPEGGSFFYHNMSMVLDGHTGIEHSVPVAPLYKDVINLWGNSRTAYTPTLIVGYGGIWGENYWYQKTNVWEKQRLLSFMPRGILDSRSRRREMIPDDDFGHIWNSKSVKALLDAGTKVNLGAHGQLQGLGAHWELWMLQQGGMSNMEALRAATLSGAEYIGMDKEIGSLENGKLADLVVMDKNPLDNIFNSETIRYVMVNGRLYDASTMNETGLYDRERKPFYWETGRSSEAFPWHEESHGFGETRCGCFH